MPHVGAAALAQYVVPAAIGAGAQIFGAHKASKSNDKATATQAAANAAALQYQKEQQAKADARQAELDRKEEARWNAEQANIAADRARLAPLQALKAQLQGQRLTGWVSRFLMAMARRRGHPRCRLRSLPRLP